MLGTTPQVDATSSGALPPLASCQARDTDCINPSEQEVDTHDDHNHYDYYCYKVYKGRLRRRDQLS
jgi:hypothetical protein